MPRQNIAIHPLRQRQSRAVTARHLRPNLNPARPQACQRPRRQTPQNRNRRQNRPQTRNNRPRPRDRAKNQPRLRPRPNPDPKLQSRPQTEPQIPNPHKPQTTRPKTRPQKPNAQSNRQQYKTTKGGGLTHKIHHLCGSGFRSIVQSCCVNNDLGQKSHQNFASK